jgi:hypothetical protein
LALLIAGRSTTFQAGASKLEHPNTVGTGAEAWFPWRVRDPEARCTIHRPCWRRECTATAREEQGSCKRSVLSSTQTLPDVCIRVHSARISQVFVSIHAQIVGCGITSAARLSYRQACIPTRTHFLTATADIEKQETCETGRFVLSKTLSTKVGSKQSISGARDTPGRSTALTKACV